MAVGEKGIGHRELINFGNNGNASVDWATGLGINQTGRLVLILCRMGRGGGGVVPPYNTPLPIFILKQSVNRGITVARVCPTKPAIYMIMSWGKNYVLGIRV